MSEESVDYKEYARQMRENCVKNADGNIICSGELWEEIATIIEGCRKQGENVIELPCKVGEMVYLPWEFDGVRSIAYLTVTHIIFDREHNYVKTDFDTDDEAYYDKYQCGSYEFEDFGKIVFINHEEAENALAKMKGGAE